MSREFLTLEPVDAPSEEGLFIFRGYGKTRGNQLRYYKGAFPVEKMNYGRQWGMKVSPNTWRPVDSFEGEFWKVVFPR